METLLPEFAKFGLGGIIAFGAIWLWQRDQKKFEQHLLEDREREREMKEQAEKDRDRVMDVVIANSDALKDLRHSIELQDVHRGDKS